MNTYEERAAAIIREFGDWFEDSDRWASGQMTDHLKPYTALFEPIQINGLKVKNRILMGPMGNVNMADEMGRPNQKMIAYFTERAKGGVGLITSGMVPVSMAEDPSYGDVDATGIFPRLDTHRSAYSGWRAIAEGCHAHGARFFLQLAPGMGRVGNPECLTKKFKLPISASWHRNWYIPQIPCRPISNGQIRRIIKKTAQAAADCQVLGIDGVYLHGHSGYLIEQLTDPAYNKRKLGPYSHYQRFGLDLVQAVRDRVGPDYPIYYRINLFSALAATYGDRMTEKKALKRLRNERTVTMTLEYMRALVKAGVDMFDVDLGSYENWWLPHPPNGMPPGTYLEVASLVKDYFAEHQVVSNKGLQVPIVGVGKLGAPDLAEAALRNGKCDIIMLARPLLADPDWPNKVFADDVASITPCIGDHEGCLGQLAIGGHPHCAVNPRTAFEDVFGPLEPASVRKKVGVVGAGPCGVTAAVTLAERGHRVVLYDRHDQAGGMLLTGGVPKIKYEIMNYVRYLNHALKTHNVEVRFGTEVSPQLLASEEFDSVITCTGSKSVRPPVKGIDRAHVVTAIDFLNDSDSYRHHSRFVVVGGADVGCEVAHMIAYEWNKPVTVVEMGPYLMPTTCTSNRHHMIYYLNEKGVVIRNCTRLTEVAEDYVTVQCNISKTVPDPTESWTPLLPKNVVNPFEKSIKEELSAEIIPADCVILATGAAAADSLYEQLKAQKSAKEIINIGDAHAPGRVLEAVKAGYRVGRAL